MRKINNFINKGDEYNHVNKKLQPSSHVTLIGGVKGIFLKSGRTTAHPATGITNGNTTHAMAYVFIQSMLMC
jgi:hypothetical protein